MGKHRDQEEPGLGAGRSAVSTDSGRRLGTPDPFRPVRKAAPTKKSGSAPRSLGRHPGGRRDSACGVSCPDQFWSQHRETAETIPVTRQRSTCCSVGLVEAGHGPVGPPWRPRGPGEQMHKPGEGVAMSVSDCSARQVWMDPREA